MIGVPVDCIDYSQAIAQIRQLAGQDRPSAVCAANTHIVTAVRRQPDFAAILNRFDLILPDGMPLVWAMNRKGAELKDRVYGPQLMRETIRSAPHPYRHYFFGGTEQCLADLIPQITRLQPEIVVAGKCSPPFRPWTERDLAAFAASISRADADFVWVALGGEKQERWIVRNLARFQKGVFLAVGDAFELLAGRRTWAPGWMQRSGLTWLFRLLQKPGRLFSRYLVYNTFFVFYLAFANHARGRNVTVSSR